MFFGIFLYILGMENEIWKPVVGYEGLYEVSNLGKVKTLGKGKSNFSKHEKEIKYSVSYDGYYRVQLYKNGIKRCHLLARIVWSSFNGVIPDGYEVNHIDEDKSNNSLSNLNLLTKADNIRWGTKIKRTAEKTKNGKCSKPILQYSIDNQFIKEYPSITEAKRQLGFSTSAISWCCQGKRNTAYGYKWKYKKEAA